MRPSTRWSRASSVASSGIGLAQRPVGQPVGQVGETPIGWGGRGGIRVGGAGAERGVQQRRELVDVRTQDDHVAGLEGGVVGEGMADGVAGDLHLPGSPVAGVDLDRPIRGIEHHAFVRVGPPRPSRGRPGGSASARMSAWMRPSRVVGGATSTGWCDWEASAAALEHELHLAGVAAPRAQQRVGRDRPRGVTRSGHGQRRWSEAGNAIPQRQRRVEGEEVDIPLSGDGPEHVEVGGGEPGETEQRDAGRELDVDGPGPQAGAGLGHPLRWARAGDPLSQLTPQSRLPLGIGRHVGERAPAGVVEPREHHVGPVDGVAVEQVGQVPGGGEAPGPAEHIGVVVVAVVALVVRVVGAEAEVAGQQRHPGFAGLLVDQLQQRPHRSFRPPGILGAVDAGGLGQHVAHQPAREGELDIGAHAVVPACRRAHGRRDPMGEPPLDPAGRDRDHLGIEGISGRRGHQLDERVDEGVGPLAAMDSEHGRSWVPGRRDDR